MKMTTLNIWSCLMQAHTLFWRTIFMNPTKYTQAALFRCKICSINMDDGVKSRRCERMDVGWWLDRDADLHVAEHKIPALVTDYIKAFLGMHEAEAGRARRFLRPFSFYSSVIKTKTAFNSSDDCRVFFLHVVGVCRNERLSARKRRRFGRFLCI